MAYEHLESLVGIVAVASLLAACGQAPDGDDGSDESPGTVQQALQQGERSSTKGTKGRGHVAGVMTRNVYLGADLAPAVRATSLSSFVGATGAVLRQATATNFPVRAKGLAAEILKTNPDLVSLQEVALWRTGAPTLAPLFGAPKTATTVRYDFLELLLGELNAGEERYRSVVVQEELDLEAPADENGTSGDGPAPVFDAELNARLTLRNVVLERVGAGVHVGRVETARFDHLLTFTILGVPFTWPRGYASVEARVRGAGPFRLVDTHLEPYDPTMGPVSVGALQAGELVAHFGPASGATGDRPVVLAGDLNSDGATGGPLAQEAYRTLVEGGFVERSAARPPTCCITSSFDLTGGSAAELVSKVDHIMTNAPNAVKLVSSVVTGRTMQDGYWDSDHAGVFSALRFGLEPAPMADFKR